MHASLPTSVPRMGFTVPNLKVYDQEYQVQYIQLAPQDFFASEVYQVFLENGSYVLLNREYLNANLPGWEPALLVEVKNGNISDRQ